MCVIISSWASWMGIKSLNIVEEGEQGPLTLNLSFEPQRPWVSPLTTSNDLCMVLITTKWYMGTITRLVMNQEWVSRFTEG